MEIIYGNYICKVVLTTLGHTIVNGGLIQCQTGSRHLTPGEREFEGRGPSRFMGGRWWECGAGRQLSTHNAEERV